MKKNLENIILVIMGLVFLINLLIDSSLWSDIITFIGFVLVLLLVINKKKKIKIQK